MTDRHMEIQARRRQQDLSELERKAKKAKRRGIYTQEDLDFAFVKAMDYVMNINWQDAPERTKNAND